MTDHICTTSVQ